VIKSWVNARPPASPHLCSNDIAILEYRNTQGSGHTSPRTRCMNARQSRFTFCRSLLLIAFQQRKSGNAASVGPAAFPDQPGWPTSVTLILRGKPNGFEDFVSPWTLNLSFQGILCFPPPKSQAFSPPGGSSFTWRTPNLASAVAKETTLNPRKHSRINFQSFLLQCVIGFPYKYKFSRLEPSGSR
jgi:hypothetical protein